MSVSKRILEDEISSKAVNWNLSGAQGILKKRDWRRGQLSFSGNFGDWVQI